MRFSPEDIGRMLRGFVQGDAVSASAEADPQIAKIETLWSSAQAKAQSAGKSAGTGERIRLTASAVNPVRTQAAHTVAPRNDMFAEFRQANGLLEDHPNILYVDVLLSHADKVMGNEGHDMIPIEVWRSAEKTLWGQPIDVAEDFWDALWGGTSTHDANPPMDHHQRQRNGDVNGIRGFVYASKIVETPDSGENGGSAEIWVGVVIWAQDFPGIACAIADKRDFLGSSFDLLADAYEQRPEMRILKNIYSLGGTILYQNRAADSATELGSVRYQGMEVGTEEALPPAGGPEAERASEASASRAHPNTDTAPATPPEPAATTEENSPMPTNTTVNTAAADAEAARILELETQAQAAADAAAALEARVTAAEARAEKAEKDLADFKAGIEQEKAIAARMGELEGILPFASDAERSAAREAVASANEDRFENLKLKREIQKLTASADAGATAQVVEAAPAGESVATEASSSSPIIHNGTTKEIIEQQTVPGVTHTGTTPLQISTSPQPGEVRPAQAQAEEPVETSAAATTAASSLSAVHDGGSSPASSRDMSARELGASIKPRKS